MNNINKEGMSQGVKGSAVFVLFMSEGVFTRPFVRFEIKEAIAAEKQIILVHETDGRFGKFKFFDEKIIDANYEKVVKDYLLAEYESIGWERRNYKMAAVLGRIIKQFESRPKGNGGRRSTGMSVGDLQEGLSSSSKVEI